MTAWLTVAELAERLRVREHFVREQVRPGGPRSWPCHRTGGRIKFTPQDVAEIEALTAQPARGRRAS